MANALAGCSNPEWWIRRITKELEDATAAERRLRSDAQEALGKALEELAEARVQMEYMGATIREDTEARLDAGEIAYKIGKQIEKLRAKLAELRERSKDLEWLLEAMSAGLTIEDLRWRASTLQSKLDDGQRLTNWGIAAIRDMRGAE